MKDEEMLTQQQELFESESKDQFNGGDRMNALVINCSPVKNGATAEIVHIVSECLQENYEVKSICIDDYFSCFNCFLYYFDDKWC